jgi:hypothetical protein
VPGAAGASRLGKRREVSAIPRAPAVWSRGSASYALHAARDKQGCYEAWN